jgi:hypothetical protein
VADLIDIGMTRRLYRSHLRGIGRHGGTLWALLVLARWAERFLSDLPPEAPSPQASMTSKSTDRLLSSSVPKVS